MGDLKRDLKEDIMEAARQLFGERGYNSVSMRDIAQALDISVGNLTYHFPKKEDLIEAVITTQHEGYRPPEPVEDIASLHAFFCRNFRFHSEKRFYFRHYTQLAEICPRIYEIQCEVRRNVERFLTLSLARLEEEGLLKPELFPGQRAGLVQVMLLVCIHGELHFERAGADDTVRAGLESLWGIVAPCLTERGQSDLRALGMQQT